MDSGTCGGNFELQVDDDKHGENGDLGSDHSQHELPHLVHPQPLGRVVGDDTWKLMWPRSCAMCSHVGAMHTQGKSMSIAK